MDAGFDGIDDVKAVSDFSECGMAAVLDDGFCRYSSLERKFRESVVGGVDEELQRWRNGGSEVRTMAMVYLSLGRPLDAD